MYQDAQEVLSVFTMRALSRPSLLLSIGLSVLGAVAVLCSGFPATAAVKEGCFYLANGEVRFAVSKADGHVVGAWNVRTRERYLTDGVDRYVLETRSADPVRIDETTDRVVQVVSKKPLRLRCRNGVLPLTMVKEYMLEGDRLVKRVTFEPQDPGEQAFLTYVSSVALEERFAETGFYIGAIELTDVIPATRIDAPKSAKRDLVSRLFLLSNFRKGYSFAHYRHKINGRLCLPWDSGWTEKAAEPQFLPPYGWEFGVCTQPVAKRQSFSAEVHYKIFKGSQMRFWEDYRNLPEIKAWYRDVVGERPEWFDRVKLMLLCDYETGPHPQTLHRVKQALEFVDEGNILTVCWPMAGWPEYPSSGIVTGLTGAKLRPEAIRRRVDQYHSLSPRVKVMFYTYMFSAQEVTRVYQEHPEWFMNRNKQGDEESAYGGGVANYLTMISAPGCSDYFLKMYDDLVRTYNLDAVYLDFGSSQNSRIDWERNRVDQPTDWFDFYSQWRLNTKQIGPEQVLFFGRTMPFSDGGFMELGKNTINGESWRIGANYVYAVKVMQSLDPRRWVAPLYWKTSEDPFFTNYLVGMGLKPGHDRFVFFPTGLPGVLPYVNAAYETRHVRLLDTEVSPSWRTDHSVQLEVYPLRQGEAAFIFLVNHTGQAGRFTVSVDTADLGCRPGRKAFVWLFTLSNPLVRTGKLSEAMQKAIYRDTSWGLDLCVAPSCLGSRRLERKLSLDLELPPDVLNMGMVTHSPALVYSVNGRRTNFWQPTSLDVSVTGRIDRAASQVTLQADCRQEKAELLVCIPPEWHPEQVTGASGFKTVFMGRPFVLVPVGPGKSRITIFCSRTAQTARVRSVEVMQAPQPGGEARFKVTAEGAAPALSVTLTKDGIPCYLNEVAPSPDGAFALPIPEDIEGGDYVMMVSTGAGGSVTLPLAIPAGRPVQPPRTASRPPWGPKQKQVSEVNREVGGLKVLQSGTETFSEFEGTDDTVASVRLDGSVRLEAGTRDEAVAYTGYAVAGVELEGAKALDLRVANTIYGSFHLRGPNLLNTPNVPAFAGVALDFHTDQGYAKRVLLSLSAHKSPTSLALPSWGAARQFDELLLLKSFTATQDQFTLDLTQYAPTDWDGRVWFSVLCYNLTPARRLAVELASPQGTGQAAIVGVDFRTLTQKREVTIPRLEGTPTDDVLIQSGARVSDFTLVSSGAAPGDETEAYLAYTQDGIHVLVRVYTDKQKLETGFAHRENRIWLDDCVEILLSPDVNQSYFHFIANSEGAKYTGYNEPSKFPNERTLDAPWNVTPSPLRAGYWQLRFFIPFSTLRTTPKSGDRWGMNLCHHEAAAGYFHVAQNSSWSHCPSGWFTRIEEFGTLIFR